MKFVAIVTRILKAGKTYDDYRKVWFHTTGFGLPNIIHTIVNAHNPREIISIGYTDLSEEQLKDALAIDVQERIANPLDEIVESTIVRTYGVVVAVDDFSAAGKIDYSEPSIDGIATNYNQIVQTLENITHAIKEASKKRDRLKKNS